jgi:hypothetical protein
MVPTMLMPKFQNIVTQKATKLSLKPISVLLQDVPQEIPGQLPQKMRAQTWLLMKGVQVVRFQQAETASLAESFLRTNQAARKSLMLRVNLNIFMAQWEIDINPRTDGLLVMSFLI